MTADRRHGSLVVSPTGPSSRGCDCCSCRRRRGRGRVQVAGRCSASEHGDQCPLCPECRSSLVARERCLSVPDPQRPDGFWSSRRRRYSCAAYVSAPSLEQWLPSHTATIPMNRSADARKTFVDGNLLAQPVDAVVNAWHRTLPPQGVSGAIERRAGLTPFRELRTFGGLPLGAAILPTAGWAGSELARSPSSPRCRFVTCRSCLDRLRPFFIGFASLGTLCVIAACQCPAAPARRG